MAMATGGDKQHSSVSIQTNIKGDNNTVTNMFNSSMTLNFGQETSGAQQGLSSTKRLQRPPSDPWIEITQPHFKKLVEKLDVMKIADTLFEKKLITPREFRGVRRRSEDPKSLPEDVARWLLAEVFPNKHKGSLKTFIEILEEHEDTGLKELGSILRADYAELTSTSSS